MRGGNELLVMEMLFENLLEPLLPPELAAAMSVIIFEKENSGKTVIQNTTLRRLVEKMELIVTRIHEVETACGMAVDLEEEKKCIHSDFMEVAYNWCKGMTFSAVMQGIDMDEGFVVNQLLRTVTIIRKLGDVANEIGNPSLRYKCQEAEQAMLRDIVFTPSLYLVDLSAC